MIIRKGTFTCRFINSDTAKTFSTLEEAKAAAEKYCGNSSCSQPFPNEKTTLFYGPGDGTTSVMIREDIEFVKGGV